MTLSQLKQGESAIIATINADKTLKHRFHAFGFGKGVIVTVNKYSMAKGTMEVAFKRNKIALRTSEATCIEVEAIT